MNGLILDQNMNQLRIYSSKRKAGELTEVTKAQTFLVRNDALDYLTDSRKKIQN